MEMEMTPFKLKMLLLPLMLSAALCAPAQQAQPDGARAAEAAMAAERARAAAGRAQAAGNAAGRDAQRAARDAERAARDAARAARTLQPAPTEQEQLAIAALEGLMAAPPERALPLLKRVLEGPQTDLVKMRALFVLSQIDGNEAQQILLGRARSGSGELRLEAIRVLGIGGNEASLAALKDIYAAGDREVREAVLHAYLISGRSADLAALARLADNEEDAEQAIQTLGAMGALAELRQLGDLGKHGGALVHAYAIAGDLDSLRKLAQSADDANVRVDAVRSIGIVGSPESAQALHDIYKSSKDTEVRDAALQGLMIQGDETVLLQIYRASSDAQEKQAVLRHLTIIGGDAALEAIDAALQGQAP
jgi:HEAT repeat protein